MPSNPYGPPSHRFSAAWLFAALLVSLPALYVTSYLALIDPAVLGNVVDAPNRRVLRTPVYRVGGSKAERFFWPVYLVDRQLRPERWPTTEFAF